MTVKLTNQTQYANIYTLYDANDKAVGTKEKRLAGRDTGTYYYSVSSLSRQAVKSLFKLYA